jgi:exonuclease SbcC
MIPLRIHLQGFLSYKDEQEIDFSGAPVWLLAGLNGSGKSSIFDAVTYALFGHHRGGGTDAIELINKDSVAANVTFEFTLEGRPYLIERNLQRNKQGGVKAAQQIHRLGGNGQWEAIENTNLQKGFKEWIDQHIGLNYETFTSSVLLLQGRAEKLLDSTAKGRFEVLAGIVDLDRYERLHRRADEERKGLESHVKTCRERLTNLPEVSDLALVEVEARIEAAEKERDLAQVEWDRWRDFSRQAEEWADLQSRLGAARQRVLATEKTLAEALKIESDFQRLQELNVALPRVQDFVAARTQIHTAQERLAELQGQRQKAQEHGQQLAEQFKRARDGRTLLIKKIEQDDAALRTLTEDMRQLNVQVEKLNEIDRLERERQRLLTDAKRLPADPKEELRKAREQVRQAEELKQALGPLGRLRELRDQLRQSLAQETAAAKELAKLRQTGEQMRGEVDRLRPQVEETTAARQRAEADATRDRTLHEQARKLLDEFLQTDGSKVCRLCGQALSPAHWKTERQRREAEVTKTDGAARISNEAAQAAIASDKTQREQLTRLEEKLRQAREAYKVHNNKVEQLKTDIQRRRDDLALIFKELSQPFRDKVAAKDPVDWLTTTYPSAEDLETGARQVGALPTLHRSESQALEQLNDWNAMQGQLTTVTDSLKRLRAALPGDAKTLRETHVRQQTQEKVLQDRLSAQRKESNAAQSQLDGLSGERELLHKQLAELDNEVTRQEERRQQGQQGLERARKLLPAALEAQADTLGAADAHRLHEEHQALIEARTAERARQLPEARAGQEMQRQEVTELETQEARMAPQARLPGLELAKNVQQAKEQYQVRDDALAQVRQQQCDLQNQRRQRDELGQELLRQEEQLVHAKLLATLLSRDRLQLHLVRRAERQVVDHANAVLDRLSGGQLFLRLAGQAAGEDNSAKALELEVHNRITGDKPINVAFLSGSQRFRVAVSLALGIGQYASRQHRPLESVIIDEGFGCLDRFGRQLMIQELQNLGNQMRCILLVSHQEEFADAFTASYRFELANGSTVARRFQR